MPPRSLPSPHSFLTSLFSSLLFPSASPSANPTPLPPSNGAPSSKPLLLTLHCLFPSHFLPALDLLDRRLVRRYVSTVASSPEAGEAIVDLIQNDPGKFERSAVVVYYVRSLRRVRHRAASRHDVAGTSYEVRTRAWNCTCEAFALAAFTGGRGLGQGGDGRGELLESGQGWDEDDGMGCNEGLGGLALGSDVQICKHLLACVLVERCRELDGYVETMAIGKAEMAGWATGWDG